MPVGPAKPTHACRRCGTCCAKGGPALHLEDREKVASGKIPLKTLFTIRQGEPAFDNVRGRIEPAANDIIKIKGAAEGDGTCRFLDQQKIACGIYEHRPIECRLLACWDTAALAAMYDRDRLTRGDLLSRLPGLIDLVTEHQKRCDYPRIGQWATRIRSGEGQQEAIQALLELMRYDQSLRKVTVERTRLDPEMVEFLFGRPLHLTIRLFRLRLARQGSALTIEPYL
jgi:Fe-S-cluster containining protein